MGTKAQHPINNYPGSYTEAFNAWFDEGTRLLDQLDAYESLQPADLERCEVMLSYAGIDPADICDMMEQADPIRRARSLT